MRRSNKDRFHDLMQEEGKLHLLLKKENLSSKKKDQLLKMAIEGKHRPQYKTKIGAALFSYTNLKSTCYDLEFTKRIKSLRPDWFVLQSDIANQKKEQLLEMAKNGEPKPVVKKHPLGCVFYSYISLNKECYDEEFVKELKKIRPDWLITPFDIASQNKKELLKMAKSGEIKPVVKKHPLGCVFREYISFKSQSYDEEFTKELKKIRPDWLITPSDIANQKKDQLLEMAKSGKPKPGCTTKWGIYLNNYTKLKSACYDPEFVKTLKRIKPDWLITPFDKANQKKDQLLKMAKNKESKPFPKKHPLGANLNGYICSSSYSYDKEFVEKLKKIRPDWLITQSDRTNKKKKQLLEAAKNGKPKPKYKTKLGIALHSYVDLSQSPYDKEFVEKLKKIRPDWLITQSDRANQKKKQLLKIAKNGDNKPHSESKLGKAFRSYKYQYSTSYDPVFIKKIKKIRPDWFITRFDIANQKKEQLLEMAKNGEDKSHYKTELGKAFGSYICQHSISYDPEFIKKIKKIRPDWFITRFDIVNQKKQKLLKMAKNKESKPHHKTELGGAFRSYICQHCTSYDEIFIEKIKKIRPDWFIKPSDENKKQLLEMAKNGESKPHYKTEFGGALNSYIRLTSGSYDSSFTKKIKKIRPDWFTSETEKIKQQLLKMAKNRDSKPKYKTRLGRNFCKYTKLKSTSYDPELTKKIKKLCPDWFVLQSDKANQKKKQLLKMAKNGNPRPNCESKLGQSLSSYIRLNHGCYDLAFTKKIKKLCPDWFVTQSDKVKQKKEQLLKIAKNGDNKPKNGTKLSWSLSSYISSKSDCYDPVFDKKIRKLRPDWFKRKSKIK